jgi:hypothetical protein
MPTGEPEGRLGEPVRVPWTAPSHLPAGHFELGAWRRRRRIWSGWCSAGRSPEPRSGNQRELDGAHPVAEHLRHPRVAKEVRVHALGGPGPRDSVLNHLVDAALRERLVQPGRAPAVGEEDAVRGPLDRPAVDQPLQPAKRGWRERDPPPPAHLAEHPQVRLPPAAVDVRLRQLGQLVEPEPAVAEDPDGQPPPLKV